MSDDRNKIVFFSDLEGTLISEEGNFNDEQFYNFAIEISKLAKTLKADVQLVIVSPMGPNYMTKILREMDRRLTRPVLSVNRDYAVDITNAAADFNDIINDDINEKYDHRIDALTSVIGTRASIDLETKARFVKDTLTTKQHFPTKEPLLYLYSGNGNNDISAMKYINNLPNGITLCPRNASESVKKVARIQSECEEAQGIADCIKQVREKIEQRKNGVKSEEKQIQAEETK